MTRTRSPHGALGFEERIASVPGLDHGLWSAIHAFGGERRVTRILFTGTAPGEGVTVAAAAAAIGLARHQRAATSLVETDLQRPALAGYLDLPQGPGLSELLAGEASLDEALVRVPGCPDLTVLGAGGARRAEPGEFASDLAEGILGRLVGPSRFTILDAPPITTHPEVRSLVRHADAVVLVLRARSSRKADAEAAAAVLEQVGLPLLGTVLNRFKPDSRLLS